MTREEIKYAALAELGYTEEPNFDADDDNGVNHINTAYPRIYSLALQSFDWSFAYIKEEVDDRTSSTGKYKYKYELPEDLLYLRGVYSDESCRMVIKHFERNGNTVYTNSPNLYISYTKKVCEDELPAYFVEYLIYKLASQACTKVTGDQNLLQELMNKELLAFTTAKNADISQQPVRILPTGTFVDVRY